MPTTTIYLLCTSPNPSVEFYETKKLAEFFGREYLAEDHGYDEEHQEPEYNVEEMTWPEGLTVFPEGFRTVVREWMCFCYILALDLSLNLDIKKHRYWVSKREDFKATVFEGQVPAFETDGKRVFLDGKLVHEFDMAFEVDILKKVLAGDV